MKKGIKNKNEEEIIELIPNKIWYNYKRYFIKINISSTNKILILSLMFLMSYFIYFLSLEKCMDGFDICGTKDMWILIKSIEVVLSSLILSILIEGMIFKIISKFHLLHIFFVYIYFFYYSHGIDFHDHGFFNFIGCLTVIILILLVLTPLNILIYLLIVKKNKIYTLIFFSFLLIFVFLTLKISKTYMNCDDWARGLNNTIIENDINKYSCTITFPKFCPYKIGQYIFDFSKIKGKKCDKMKQDTKKNLLSISKNNYINEKTKHIGLPLKIKSLNFFFGEILFSIIFKVI
jgi:hypothetical protein